MLKSVYDTNDNGIVDNAEKVNNHTVEENVPLGAVFTDTTYSEATTSKSGLMSSTDKSNLDSNTSARHTHSNKNTLDNISSTDITNWNNKSDFSGSYDDLSDKPTIPSEVTETTVTNWGFTKNSGTITGISMNGSSKGTSGIVDLGTVITSHQDISGKENTSNKITSLSSSSTDIQYPSAKCVYDKIDEIEEKTTYSTEEKEIGQWISGKKIYRKVINIGNMQLTANTSFSVAHNISNFGTLIDFQLRMMYGSTTQYSYWDGIRRLTANSTNINIFPSEASTFTNAFAILEYTKTTD